MRILSILLLIFCLFAPRLFYGFNVYKLWDEKSVIDLISSIGIVGDSGAYFLSEVVDFFDGLSEFFGTTMKRLLFLLSMGLSVLLVFVSCLFSYQKILFKRYAFGVGFLLSIHPLLVWLSGEPDIHHFSGSLFSLGVLICLLNPMRFFLHSVIGVLFIILSIFISPSLFTLAMIFYLSIFLSNIGDFSISSGSKEASPFNIVTGLGFLVTVFMVSILSKGDNFFNVAPKTITQTLIGISSFIINDDFLLNLKFLSRNLVKAYYSPVILIAPLFLFFQKLRVRELLPVLVVGVSSPVVGMVSIAQSNYHFLYSSVVFLTICTVFALREFLKLQRIPFVKGFFLFVLVGVLLGGLVARTQRDYHRRQSMNQIGEYLKSIPDIDNQVLHTPFGQRLPVEGFSKAIKSKAIRLRKIPLIFKEDLSRLVLAEPVVYLFIDDYFIYEATGVVTFGERVKLSLRALR